MEATVLCKICEKETMMLGTRMCDPCWAMDRRFRHLLVFKPALARKWLAEQVAADTRELEAKIADITKHCTDLANKLEDMRDRTIEPTENRQGEI